MPVHESGIRSRLVREVMGDAVDGEMNPAQEGRRRKLEVAFDAVLPDLRRMVAAENAESLRDCTMDSSKEYADGWHAAADWLQRGPGDQPVPPRRADGIHRGV